ncbi:hypothetical protein PHJA_002291700 [Phtheirospermum japonicum]|uniref:Uncharacterized protein n=1 Tax=Phtheirospermum japonicum TaxID=374723 RepID=A0A830CLC3_9LAMI|nr:hypothetical protein PHJA_002291700 [Phtheirospermum japonicum]
MFNELVLQQAPTYMHSRHNADVNGMQHPCLTSMHHMRKFYWAIQCPISKSPLTWNNFKNSNSSLSTPESDPSIQNPPEKEYFISYLTPFSVDKKLGEQISAQLRLPQGHNRSPKNGLSSGADRGLLVNIRNVDELAANKSITQCEKGGKELKRSLLEHVVPEIPAGEDLNNVVVYVDMLAGARELLFSICTHEQSVDNCYRDITEALAPSSWERQRRGGEVEEVPEG